MIRSATFIVFAIVSASPAVAGPLIVPSGESWVFSIERGQPVRPHRVQPAARPAAGQVKVTVIAGMGTAMTVTNNSRIAYTFRAELIGAPNGKSRTCTLPPNGIPALEYWPVKAKAVRVGSFKPSSADGSCP